MYKKLGLIFSVLFLDFFSFSAVIAFLPLFFLSTSLSFFSISVSSNLRYILLGILAATYPIAQLIAAPLLGHLSDKIGRKGILLYSYLGNTVGYILCGTGILTTSIFLLFLGNFVAGLMGVNMSTTNAIISDVSASEKRSKFFSIPHLMLGIGFILGPFIAGKIVTFSSHVFDACFYLFLACAMFSCINFFLIYFFWTSDNDKMISANPTEILWKDLFSCTREIKILLFAEFLIFFGWYFFIKTFQVFLIEGIKCTEGQVFDVYSQYGLWFTISQIIFIFWLHRYSKSEKFFRHFITLLALSIFVLYFAKSYFAACLIVPLFTIAYGMLIPSLTSLVSDYASSHNNGKVMGLHQSIQAFAKVGGPLIAGCVLTLTPLATVLLSPLFILASQAVFALRKKVSDPI
jgi:MFS transporter, DHA1 family, tetracycline resistance protein